MTDDADLRERVALLERRLAEVERRLDLAPPSADGGISPEVLALVQAGKKIQAIKVYREQTGVDLRTARDTIERIAP